MEFTLNIFGVVIAVSCCTNFNLVKRKRERNKETETDVIAYYKSSTGLLTV